MPLADTYRGAIDERLPRPALDGGEGKIMNINTCLNTHTTTLEPLETAHVNNSGTAAGTSTANGLVTSRNPTYTNTHFALSYPLVLPTD
jgi:hypothetical protein